MGFFDKFSDSKYQRIGEYLASYAVSMCTNDQINKLLSDCEFSDSEKLRFKFDFMIANLVVATHAVSLVVGDIKKIEKIIEPMFTIHYLYLKKMVTEDICIGDFIVNDNEWKFLKQHHLIDNPDIRTDSKTFLNLIYAYRRNKYSDALAEGFNRFLEERNTLGPMSALVRLFALNFPSSKENTDNLVVTLCMFLAATHSSIMEYCQKNT